MISIDESVALDSEAQSARTGSTARAIVLHYHLFKNAGTSLDSSFKENLNKDEWITREFSGPLNKRKDDLVNWISDNPNARCFSSHTAPLPPPQLKDVTVLPVIFLRHPLDRIASAYAFEAKQDAPSFGSVLARNTSLSGYIETRLTIQTDYQCRNFHAHRLAEMYPNDGGPIDKLAALAIEELPFTGVVEHFSKSIDLLQNCLNSTALKDITLNVQRKNTSQSTHASLDKKLDELRIILGNELYAELERVNAVDLKLHSLVSARYR